MKQQLDSIQKRNECEYKGHLNEPYSKQSRIGNEFIRYSFYCLRCKLKVTKPYMIVYDSRA